MIKELIINLVLCFYVLPLMFNLMIFLVLKVWDDSFPFRRMVLMNLIPGLNLITSLVLAYQVVKQCGHEFIAKKDGHKYAIGIGIFELICIVTAFICSIASGIGMTIVVVIISYIAIKG